MPTRRICCWLGCEAKYEGDQPANWRHLLMFWSAEPISSFADIPDATWDRDGVLCPQHVAELEAVLKLANQCHPTPRKNANQVAPTEVFGLVRIARLIPVEIHQHQPVRPWPARAVFDSPRP